MPGTRRSGRLEHTEDLNYFESPPLDDYLEADSPRRINQHEASSSSASTSSNPDTLPIIKKPATRSKMPPKKPVQASKVKKKRTYSDTLNTTLIRVESLEKDIQHVIESLEEEEKTLEDEKAMRLAEIQKIEEKIRKLPAKRARFEMVVKMRDELEKAIDHDENDDSEGKEAPKLSPAPETGIKAEDSNWIKEALGRPGVDIGSKDGSATVSSPSTFKLPPATSKRYTVTIEDDDELESFEKQTSNSLFD